MWEGCYGGVTGVLLVNLEVVASVVPFLIRPNLQVPRFVATRWVGVLVWGWVLVPPGYFRPAVCRQGSLVVPWEGYRVLGCRAVGSPGGKPFKPFKTFQS